MKLYLENKIQFENVSMHSDFHKVSFLSLKPDFLFKFFKKITPNIIMIAL